MYAVYFVEEIYYFENILRLCSLLCLLPPVKNKKILRSSLINSYAYGSSLFSFICSAYFIYIRLTSFQHNRLNKFFAFLDYFQESYMIVCLLSQSICNVFLFKNELQVFLDKSVKVDSFLQIEWENYLSYYRFYVCFLIAIIFNFTLNSTLWIIVIGFKNFCYHATAHFHYFRLASSYFLYFCFTQSFMHRFQNSIRFLEDLLKNFFAGEATESKFDILMDSLKKFSGIYMELSNSIVSFNTMFGISIMLNVFYVHIDIILNSALMISNVLEHFGGSKFMEMLLLTSRISWMFFSLVSNS